MYLYEKIIKLTILLIQAYQWPKRDIDPQVVLMENNDFESNNILQNVTDMYLYLYLYFVVLCKIHQKVIAVAIYANNFAFGILWSNKRVL